MYVSASQDEKCRWINSLYSNFEVNIRNNTETISCKCFYLNMYFIQMNSNPFWVGLEHSFFVIIYQLNTEFKICIIIPNWFLAFLIISKNQWDVCWDFCFKMIYYIRQFILLYYVLFQREFFFHIQKIRTLW